MTEGIIRSRRVLSPDQVGSPFIIKGIIRIITGPLFLIIRARMLAASSSAPPHHTPDASCSVGSYGLLSLGKRSSCPWFQRGSLLDTVDVKAPGAVHKLALPCRLQRTRHSPRDDDDGQGRQARPSWRSNATTLLTGSHELNWYEIDVAVGFWLRPTFH